MSSSSSFAFQLNDGRAVVRQQLAGEPRVDRLGEPPGVLEVRRPGLAPDEVGIWRVGEAAGDGLVESGAGAVEALRRALAGEELRVGGIDVARDHVGGLGVRAGDEDGRDAHDVGGEARGDEVADGLLGRQEHLAAHVPALLLRGELVLEVHARGAGLDHRLHELEDVQRAAEAGLGVGHDRGEPVALVATLGVVDLVRALQRLVDAADDVGDAVGRVEALVRVHLAGEVRVGGDLPAGEVDRLEAGLDLLDRLVAGQRARARARPADGG